MNGELDGRDSAPHTDCRAPKIRWTALPIERDEISIGRLREPTPRCLAAGLLGAHAQHHIEPHQLVLPEILKHASQWLQLRSVPCARAMITHQSNGVGDVAIWDLLQDAGQTFERLWLWHPLLR